MTVDSLKTAVILLLVPLVLFSCKQKKVVTEEDKVKEVAYKAAEYVKKKDLDGLMSLVAEDYKDEKGHDYEAIKKLIAKKLKGFLTITVMARNIDVKLEGDKATMIVDMVFIKNMEVGENLEKVPAEAIIGYRFTVKLEKRETGWKVLSASWYDAGLATLL